MEERCRFLECQIEIHAPWPTEEVARQAAICRCGAPTRSPWGVGILEAATGIVAGRIGQTSRVKDEVAPQTIDGLKRARIQLFGSASRPIGFQQSLIAGARGARTAVHVRSPVDVHRQARLPY